METDTTILDEKDRELLRLVQESFPLDAEPYRVLGDKLWIDEVSVISRLARLTQEGVIRHVGPFFDSRKLGYTGVLAAMEVSAADVDRVAAVVNAVPGVTHNYLRDGSPNMWFTLITPDEEKRGKILAEIRAKTGIQEILLFPSRRMFKVKVSLA